MAPTATGVRPDRVETHASTSRWLRDSTHTDHLAAESRLDLAQVRHIVDLSNLLRGWSTVWHAVDRCAAGAVAPADELRRAATESITWLDADLRELADMSGRPAHVTDADRVRDDQDLELRRLLAQPGGGWGVAYVLLGSRLGGSIIAPRLSTALALEDGAGTRFLVSAGTAPAGDWAAFKLRLDDAPLTVDDLDLSAVAARWTFRWVGSVIAAARARARSGS